MDFSVISQAPEIRRIVQDGILERVFHDALFPKLQFRAEATPVVWPENIGDTQIFTGNGLIKPKTRPLAPGDDPAPSKYAREQWQATVQQYADSIDSHMPTSINAIASLFLSDTKQLGLAAGQSLNRVVRNRLYNAGLAGHTVADGAQSATTTLVVKRLNGFTRARRPDLTAGEPVRFAPVSTSNPLKIRVYDTGGPGYVDRLVTGFTPDNTGDELGPGSLTINTAVTVADRGIVLADNRSYVVRSGGGDSVSSVGSTDLLTLKDLRASMVKFRNNNVPEFPDGKFHCHLDPTSESQLYADEEFQRLLRGLPDHAFYKDFAIGEILGAVLYRNSECPQAQTVGAGDVEEFDLDDPFTGELTANGASGGQVVHRALVLGYDGIKEYYQNLMGLITEAGVTGKVGTFSISNNAITIDTDRIQMIIRAPLNRLQDQVSTSYKFIGDWPFRTDSATGDAAAMKRCAVIEHGE